MRHGGKNVKMVIAALFSSVLWATPLQARSLVIPDAPSRPWIIESATYTATVEDRIARLEVDYLIRVLQEGWVEIPLTIQAARIHTVGLKGKSSHAHIVPRGDGYALATHRSGTYKVELKGSALLIHDSQFEGLNLGIPQATFSTMDLVIPHKDVEIRVEDQLYVERHPDGEKPGMKLVARLGSAEHVDVRWRTKPATVEPVTPVIYGEIHSLLTIEEELVRVMSLIEYRMTQGQTRTLLVELPAGLSVLNVRGASIDDWRISDGEGTKELTVTLATPLKDTTYPLVIETEETLDEKSLSYTLPEIRLVGVKQERGEVALARAGNVELSPESLSGMTRIDVKELPEWLQATIHSPVALAFRYHQHPYQLTLALTRHEDHPVLSAIVQQGELVSVLSRQGEILTRAIYLVKANRKQFLEVTLPQRSQLWSSIVDETSVKPVKGEAGQLLIPLRASKEGEQAMVVEIVYFERLPELLRVGELNLEGPVLDVPTTLANWIVYAPRDVHFLRFRGNLDREVLPAAFVDEPSLKLDRERIIARAAGGVASPAMEIAADKPEEEGKVAHSEPRGSFLQEMFDVEARKRKQVEQDKQGYYGDRENEDPSSSPHAMRPSSNQFFKTVGNDKDEEGVRDALAILNGRMQEGGILPLKVQLPKAGRVYRFSRIMTAQEALTLQANFVHLPFGYLPFAILGMIIAPLSGFTLLRGLRG